MVSGLSRSLSYILITGSLSLLALPHTHTQEHTLNFFFFLLSSLGKMISTVDDVMLLFNLYFKLRRR